jgi:hypothetical protein
MSTEERRNNTPDEGDLQLAIHALNGVFKVLNWIDSDSLVSVATKSELANVRHDLVVAGRMVTDDLCRRF